MAGYKGGYTVQDEISGSNISLLTFFLQNTVLLYFYNTEIKVYHNMGITGCTQFRSAMYNSINKVRSI